MMYNLELIIKKEIKCVSTHLTFPSWARSKTAYFLSLKNITEKEKKMAKEIKKRTTTEIVDFMNSTDNAAIIRVCKREIRSRKLDVIYDNYINEWILLIK